MTDQVNFVVANMFDQTNHIASKIVHTQMFEMGDGIAFVMAAEIESDALKALIRKIFNLMMPMIDEATNPIDENDRLAVTADFIVNRCFVEGAVDACFFREFNGHKNLTLIVVLPKLITSPSRKGQDVKLFPFILREFPHRL